MQSNFLLIIAIVVITLVLAFILFNSKTINNSTNTNSLLPETGHCAVKDPLNNTYLYAQFARLNEINRNTFKVSYADEKDDNKYVVIIFKGTTYDEGTMRGFLTEIDLYQIINKGKEDKTVIYNKDEKHIKELINNYNYNSNS